MKSVPESTSKQYVMVADNVLVQAMQLVYVFKHKFSELHCVVIGSARNEMHHRGQ